MPPKERDSNCPPSGGQFNPGAIHLQDFGEILSGLKSSSSSVSSFHRVKGFTVRLKPFLLFLTVSATSAAALSQVSININVPGFVQIAPPSPRYEAVPRPLPGRIWVPGRWAWNEREYVWRTGQWQSARPDYVYAPGRWVVGDGGWRWSEDQWHRRPEGRRGRNEDNRHESEDDERHDDARHCPPGQAKKGRC
jgi:hypothetical protein